MYASLLIASAAAGLCSYSALRLSGQPPAGYLAATLLGAAGNSHRIADDTDCACRRAHASFMDVPTLWRADGRRRALDCRSDPHACTTTSSGRDLVKHSSTCRQHRVPRPSYSSCASREQTSACIVPATFRRACFLHPIPLPRPPLRPAKSTEKTVATHIRPLRTIEMT